MDDEVSVTVRFNDETRAAADSYTKAYDVHLSVAQCSLRQIIYNTLQQHYVAAEAYAEQNHSRTLILQFQRSLRRIVEWDVEQRRRFVRSLGVEYATTRALRLPANISHAIGNLVHVLMFTDAEIADLVENGFTHCRGFVICTETTAGDFVIQCLQEAALHFDGTPFLFSRAVKPHQWIENRQKILKDIDRIVALVVSEMATNMVRSVCRRLMDAKAADATAAGHPPPQPPPPLPPLAPTNEVGERRRYSSAPTTRNAGAGAGAAAVGDDGTRYTDNRLLFGHVDEQQYLEHAYTRGNLRHTATPMQYTEKPSAAAFDRRAMVPAPAAMERPPAPSASMMQSSMTMADSSATGAAPGERHSLSASQKQQQQQPQQQQPPQQQAAQPVRATASLVVVRPRVATEPLANTGGVGGDARSPQNASSPTHQRPTSTSVEQQAHVTSQPSSGKSSNNSSSSSSSSNKRTTSNDESSHRGIASAGGAAPTVDVTCVASGSDRGDTSGGSSVRDDGGHAAEHSDSGSFGQRRRRQQRTTPSSLHARSESERSHDAPAKRGEPRICLDGADDDSDEADDDNDDGRQRAGDGSALRAEPGTSNKLASGPVIASTATTPGTGAGAAGPLQQQQYQYSETCATISNDIPLQLMQDSDHRSTSRSI